MDFKSLVKTKHMAVLVTDKRTSKYNGASFYCNDASKRFKMKIHDLCPHNIDRLRYFLVTHSWNDVYNADTISHAYNNCFTNNT